MKYRTMSRSEWLLLIFLSLLWGGSFFFNEILLRELRPFTLVFGRTTLAAIVLTILIYTTGKKMPSSVGVWGAFFVMGVLNNLVPFSLIVWGQQQIDSGLAAILNATTPLFSVVLAHLLTREEKLNLHRGGGVLLGLVGVTALIGPDALKGLGVQGIAQLAVLGASGSYAVAGIFGRRFREMPVMVPAAGMLACTAVMALPLAWLVDGPFPVRLAPETWGALFGLALVSTAIAYLIYFRVLATAGATNVLLVTFLIPVTSLFLGVLVLKEQVEWTLFAGMGLIFAGLILVDGRVFNHAEKV